MRVQAAIAFMSTVLIAVPASAGVADWVKTRLKQSSATAVPDAETVAAGLREALEKGATRAVQELGRDNGFWSHPTLRIPMPERLRKADQLLRRLGQGRMADDFARSLNRAAEQATPVARGIFLDAVRAMTIRDALDVLRGPPDAATQYFRRHSGDKLVAAFLPIVQRATESVGVTAQYKRLVRRVEPYGLIETRNLDIDRYVTGKALDAVFSLVAAEEQRIRTDPVARTTDLLRRVFQ